MTSPQSVLSHIATEQVEASVTPAATAPRETAYLNISSTVAEGETLSDIFLNNELNVAEIDPVVAASRDIHNLSRIRAGKPYTLALDAERHVLELTYQVDRDSTLIVSRVPESSAYEARMRTVQYERRTTLIGGVIRDNLVSSVGNLDLALRLSDIFAWDIDFTTDLRDGDTFRLYAEALFHNGRFVRYGDILAAEFTNNGQTHDAYRFEVPADGTTPERYEYFDQEGGSLRKTLLKAPLSYRRISSSFTNRRYHPILKKYQPHQGVDYAAATGTPVSSVGDGTVEFAGRKGPNGNLVIIRHPAGFKTYYGHLNGITRGIRTGATVRQGQTIGTVGSSGRSTGPHLDYRIKRGGTYVNPLTLNLPRARGVAADRIEEYTQARRALAGRLAAATLPLPGAPLTGKIGSGT